VKTIKSVDYHVELWDEKYRGNPATENSIENSNNNNNNIQNVNSVPEKILDIIINAFWTKWILQKNFQEIIQFYMDVKKKKKLLD
jgi:hypothetical protein